MIPTLIFAFQNIGILLLPSEDWHEVYNGLWGYNAILSSAAIMCVFFAFNRMSFLVGMVNLSLTVANQYALRTTMTLEVSISCENSKINKIKSYSLLDF